MAFNINRRVKEGILIRGNDVTIGVIVAKIEKFTRGKQAELTIKGVEGLETAYLGLDYNSLILRDGISIAQRHVSQGKRQRANMYPLHCEIDKEYTIEPIHR